MLSEKQIEEQQLIPDLTMELAPIPSCSGMSSQTGETFKRRTEEGEDFPTSKKSRGQMDSAPGPVPSKSSYQVMTPSRSTLRRAYFEVKLSQNELQTIIFEVNCSIAPMMAGRFLDYCEGVNHPGYVGTKLAWVQGDISRSLPLQRITSLAGGRLIDCEDQLFLIDFPHLPAKRGSICFAVKEVNDWGTIVSPEFHILLAEPGEDLGKEITTVFGQVSVGIEICELLKSQPPVTISACGLL